MKIFIDFDHTLTRGREFGDAILGELGGESAEILRTALRDFRQTHDFTLEAVSQLFEQFGFPPERTISMYEAYAKRMEEFLAPDAHEFLSALKALGHELILLTRSPDVETWQRPKVLASGLSEYFTGIEITSGAKVDVIEMLGHQEPFIFIDDLPKETEEMQARFPVALCITHEKGAPLMEHLFTIAGFANRDELKTLPLPINTAINIGNLSLEDGEQLAVTFGLDKKAVDAFKKRSCDETDEELMRFTSDHERICLGSYETWYAKERYPFGLMSKSGELAGIAWFGPKAFPSIEKAGFQTPPMTANAEWHTFAVRMYNPYRGKRLAFPFASFVFKAYNTFLPPHPLWLDTSPENAGAIRLYSKLGFIEHGHREDGRVVMIRP
ncbi:MAG: haloacid dehalogenase-like hydrolase [Patescibacteria group bacterium]|jgi:RimJ/RimL family protein N-acetyltransferase